MDSPSPSSSTLQPQSNSFVSARSLVPTPSTSSPLSRPTPTTSHSHSHSSPPISAADKGKAPMRDHATPGTASSTPTGGTGTGPASNGNGRVTIPTPATTNVGTPAGVGPGGVVRRPALNNILVNTCQKGNPVISHIRGVGWEYGDIVPDYQVGATTGVLYLSLRYHLLHPEYIHTRIEKLGQTYSLRLMLIVCDAENHVSAMKELTKVCIVNGFTMIVAWTTQEAATYLTTYKSFERKPPDLIKERIDTDFMSQLSSVLTSVKGVNKTDVVTLISSYGSFAKIAQASTDSLVQNPGVGEKKAKRLKDAFEGRFVMGKSRKKVKKSEAERRGEEGNALN